MAVEPDKTVKHNGVPALEDNGSDCALRIVLHLPTVSQGLQDDLLSTTDWFGKHSSSTSQ